MGPPVKLTWNKCEFCSRNKTFHIRITLENGYATFSVVPEVFWAPGSGSVRGRDTAPNPAPNPSIIMKKY
jgi:hypothetical protein